MVDAVLGIDVGTGSARAGLFSRDGRMLANASQPIRAWREPGDIVRQSGEDIWDAVCRSVREAVRIAGGATAVTVAGIGFDATCSMVVLDAAGAPVGVGPGGDDAQNVIVWMDHRAHAEADEINRGGHDVLRYVGGQVSLEMQTPKLLWLKRHLARNWARAAHFFDLPDFLTWRATGATSRSLCSTVCKWTYLGHEGRWDEAYFRAIGLGDLADEGFERIGTEILPIGTRLARGLSAEAAAAFGLPEGIAVGASAIDAHAGGLGVIGAEIDGAAPDDAAFDRRLALIGGTSTCHMAVSRAPRFVPGVWGPYGSAMVPDFWLNEGGQSAVGSLVDHVIATHAAAASLTETAGAEGRTIYQELNARLASLDEAADPFVMPDFHGNRSPLADATLRGMISGLALSAGPEDLARLYRATIVALAFGTRHIVETLDARGYAIDTIFATGGGTRNPVFVQAHADATGCRIVLPEEGEAVLLGAAILGAVAGGVHADIRGAMAAMTRVGRIVAPDPARGPRRGDAGFAVFRRMQQDQLDYRAMVEAAVAS